MKTAYKGYLICHNELNNLRWIEKDGQRICYVVSVDQARQIIDQDLTSVQ